MGNPIMRDSTLRFHYDSVERVITTMRQQIDLPMSLQSMAKVAYASPFHFNRTFRQVTGVPPSQFLYALRLDTARRLLMKTERKVIDICYDVGYNSVGTFTRRFTDLLGVSPTTFRELVRLPLLHLPEYPDPVTPLNGHLHSDYGLSGCVNTPGEFHGFTFIGLFDTPIPQARPIACAIATESGYYHMEDVPEGEFYLFALGLEHPIDSSACFDYDSALRGGGHQIRITHQTIHGTTNLYLRPPSPLDPPILIVLSLLMDEFFSHQHKIPPVALTAPPLAVHAHG